MSSTVVRSAFQQALIDHLAGSEIPFVPTVGEPAVNTNDLQTWVTCSFYAYESSLQYHGELGEKGACEVSVFTLPGQPDVAQQVAEGIRRHFASATYLPFSITDALPISESTGGDNTAWYGVTATVEYVYEE